MDRGIHINDLEVSGTGPGSEFMRAFKESHRNMVFLNPEELNAAMQRFNVTYNSRSLPYFLGLSPRQMRHVLYDEFSLDNVLFSFVEQPSEAYQSVPIIKEVTFYLETLASEGTIKLTARGNMPRVQVLRFYDEFKKDGDLHFKPHREDDLVKLGRARGLCDIQGWTKVEKGKLSLSKKGREMLLTAASHPAAFYRELLKTMISEFEWAFGDRFDDFEIVQDACLFNLFLLNAKAQDWVSVDEICTPFVEAFPLLNRYADVPSEVFADQLAFCFTFRFLLLFCEGFGLIEFSDRDHFSGKELKVRVSDLFRKSFRWKVSAKE